ncbi:Cys-tRNA(Pro) deacylase [Shewanella sp. NIFS-20-20]|uniref:Cys-tRNA(Pro) deacylase n=1 Tax=Shewanella sp. NIFS-20-20 TaxID=2853806 RepID=UPI001C43727F|nr:Cys-tRNA(Pro) deacylase [Shewanella sp. NIFS-20-20]MBV7317069.1 Cys-tRNA(Pro) deacylase [Shewanella sp. NIFS-20-20]
MTPATVAAKKAKLAFSLHEYQHDKDVHDFGNEVTEKLGLDPNRVFKTLMVADTAEGAPIAVALVPVSQQLNLKALAKTLGLKKLNMAAIASAQKSSGYLVGGISALGQKKGLKTVIDESARSFDTIYISAGKRGLQMSLNANDLAKALRAAFAAIATQE